MLADNQGEEQTFGCSKQLDNELDPNREDLRWIENKEIICGHKDEKSSFKCVCEDEDVKNCFKQTDNAKDLYEKTGIRCELP